MFVDDRLRVDLSESVAQQTADPTAMATTASIGRRAAATTVTAGAIRSAVRGDTKPGAITARRTQPGAASITALAQTERAIAQEEVAADPRAVVGNGHKQHGREVDCRDHDGGDKDRVLRREQTLVV
jgi:hypothetical protein